MVINNENAQDLLLEGINLLADAVKITLGPCGSNVVINNNDHIHVTKDGVTVAKSVIDNRLSTGINLIKSVAEKTAAEAGDATTTSTVLVQALLNNYIEYIKRVEGEGGFVNRLELKKEMDTVCKEVVDYVKSQSVDVGDKIKEVALISSNGDETIATNIYNIINTIGKESRINVKPADSSETTIQYSKGMTWDYGYMSNQFVTDNVKMEVEMENAYVLIFNNKLEDVKQILSELEKCRAQNIPVLIAVKDIEKDALNTLLYNHLQGTLKCCVVKIPGFEEYREDNILDLKAVIGNNNLVKKIIVTKNNVHFIQDKNNKDTKENRIALLKHRLTLPDPNTEDIAKRIININNAFATIFVGGNSELEIKEMIDRYDDAICAVKSALCEGIVKGGGNILFDAVCEILEKDEEANFNMTDTKAIFLECVLVPYNQIHENGNFNSCSIESKKDIIYHNGEFVGVDNAIDYGVIDPTKVVRLSLENATSIAGTILTTKCLIENKYVG